MISISRYECVNDLGAGNSMPIEEMMEKARKLVQRGRVEYIGDDLYNVVGDHGTYTVAKKIDGTVTCNCPGFARKKRCSHSLAVILLPQSGRRHGKRREL